MVSWTTDGLGGALANAQGVTNALKGWCERNRKKTTSLRSLCLRQMAYPWMINKTFDGMHNDIAPLCPDLEHHHIFGFQRADDNEPANGRLVPIVKLDSDEGDSAGRMIDFAGSCYGSTMQRSLALDSTGRWSNLADKLVPLCKLRNLDLGLLVPTHWIESRPEPLELDLHNNYRSYLEGTGKQARQTYAVQLKSWEEGYKVRLRHAALTLLDKFPSLQSGYFWAPANTRQAIADPESWHRWSWHVVTEQEGDISIQVDDFPEIITRRFAKNRDGLYAERENHDREYERD